MALFMKNFFTVWVLFLFSSVATAEIYEYSQNVFGMTSTACQAQADALAQKIKAAVGGETKATYCSPIADGGFDARVVSDVKVLPNLEIAVFGFHVVHYQYPGQTGPINKRYSVISNETAYSRLADCLAALPRFEQHFLDETGLTPISAQCSQLVGHHYVAQVDAFGVGHRHLYQASIDLGSSNASEAGQLDLSNYLSSKQATTTNAARPDNFLLINYFANHELKFFSFDFNEKNQFLNESQCQDALTVLEPILSKTSESPLVSLRCGKGQWQTTEQSMSLVAIFDGTDTQQLRLKLNINTYGHFSTYSECKARATVTPNSYCATEIDVYGVAHGFTLNVAE